MLVHVDSWIGLLLVQSSHGHACILRSDFKRSLDNNIAALQITDKGRCKAGIKKGKKRIDVIGDMSSVPSSSTSVIDWTKVTRSPYVST
jgi:hypothetical protein